MPCWAASSMAFLSFSLDQSLRRALVGGGLGFSLFGGWGMGLCDGA
jgi:hypothetical protein